MIGRINLKRSNVAEEIYGQAGFSQVIIFISLIALCGATAFSVDIGIGRLESQRLNAAVDAGALAAVAKLRDGETAQEVIAQEAYDITKANHVETDFSSQVVVDVGEWNFSSREFVAASLLVPGTKLNAVRVSAVRAVPVQFARVLGFSTLQPSRVAVAVTGGASHVTCMVPFGISKHVLEGKKYFDTLTIESPSPGNWGKIDIDGNMSSKENFVEAMEHGVCQEELSIGEILNPITDETNLLSPGTGFAGVKEGFQRRIAVNPHVVLLVVKEFDNGNHPVEIVGFIVARIISQEDKKGGVKWTGDIQFLDDFAGSGYTGPDEAPFAKSRALVN